MYDKKKLLHNLLMFVPWVLITMPLALLLCAIIYAGEAADRFVDKQVWWMPKLYPSIKDKK